MTESDLPFISLPEGEAALVALALDHPVAARAAFLEAVCGEDKALRAHLSGGHRVPRCQFPRPALDRLVGDDSTHSHHGRTHTLSPMPTTGDRLDVGGWVFSIA